MRRAPLGFRWMHGELIRDEDEQELISIVRSYRASGLNYSTIAEKLTSANFTSRTGSAKFSEDMVKRIDDAIMERTEPTTRARDDDPTLAELERLLVIQLEQDLDLDDPDDFDVYTKSKDLLEHIRETLRNARLSHERKAEG